MIVMFMPHDDAHHLVADGRAMSNLNDPPSDASASNGESNEKDKSPVDASAEDKFINLYITGNKDADKHDAHLLPVRPNQSAFKRVMNTFSFLTGMAFASYVTMWILIRTL